MADYALFIGWGSVVRGREETALKVFQETVEYWSNAQQDGQIDGFEPFLLEPHGGGLAGFMLVYGDRAQLDAARGREDFQRVMARAGTVVDELGVVTAYANEALGRQLGLFQQTASELT
jgi:hypothetical protein